MTAPEVPDPVKAMCHHYCAPILRYCKCHAEFWHPV
jgi:hypothetical protein